MSDGEPRAPRSWDTSWPTLIIGIAARPLVPASAPLPGISGLEHRLLAASVPCLWTAIGFGVLGVVLSLSGHHRYSGLFAVLSLLLVAVAALLASQFGLGGVGLAPALVATLPLATVLSLRESAWRRQGVKT
jgi:hypothetical protein